MHADGALRTSRAQICSTMTILLSQQNSFAIPGGHEACIAPAGLKNVETLYASRQDPERQNVTDAYCTCLCSLSLLPCSVMGHA